MTHKQKQLLSGLGVVCLLLVLHTTGLLIPKANAAAAGLAAQGSVGDIIVYVSQLLGFLNTIMQIVLLIAMDCLGFFLQSDFFTNSAMMTALNKIWVLSRDLMNLIFALMLIGVAFYTIITAKKDFIMSKISHFVIAVILVNMSWFFPRVILDVANVASATVYSIPSILPGFTCKTIDDNGAPGATKECEVIVATKVFGTAAEQDAWARQGTPSCAKGANDPPVCICYKDLGCIKKVGISQVPKSMTTGHVMISGLITSFVRLQELPKIPAAVAGPNPGIVQAGKTSLQILISVSMALIVQIALALAMLGLAVGLLIRILIIWICVAFMPFIFLGYVINGKLGTSGFGFEYDLWKEFLSAAFLPATVGIPITIGLVMLSTSASIPPPSGLGAAWTIPLLGDVKSWWALIWMFAALVILWKGAFMALSKNKIIGNVTEKIRGVGESTFSTAARLPLLAPIPIPGVGNVSAAQAMGKVRDTGDILRAMEGGRTGNKSFGELMEDRRGGPSKKDMQTASDNINGNAANTKKITDAIDALAKAKTDADRVAPLKEIQRVMGPAFANKDMTNTLAALEKIAQNTNSSPAVNNLAPQIKSLIDAERNRKP